MSSSSSQKGFKGGPGPAPRKHDGAAMAAAAAAKHVAHPQPPTHATRAKVDNRIKFLQVDKEFFQQFEQKFLVSLSPAHAQTKQHTQREFKEVIDTLAQIEQEFTTLAKQENANYEPLLKQCDDLHDRMSDCFQFVESILQQQIVPASKNEIDALEKVSWPAVKVAAYQTDTGEYSEARERLTSYRSCATELNITLGSFQNMLKKQYAGTDIVQQYRATLMDQLNEMIRFAPRAISPEADAKTILDFAKKAPQMGIMYGYMHFNEQDIDCLFNHWRGEPFYTNPLEFYNISRDPVNRHSRFSVAVVVPFARLRPDGNYSEGNYYVLLNSEVDRPDYFQYLYKVKYTSPRGIPPDIDSISICEVNPLFQTLFRLLFTGTVGAEAIATEVNALISEQLPPTSFAATSSSSSATTAVVPLATTSAMPVAATPSTSSMTLFSRSTTSYYIDLDRIGFNLNMIQSDLKTFTAQAITDERRGLFFQTLLEVMEYSPALNRQRLAKVMALLGTLQQTASVSMMPTQVIQYIADYCVDHAIMCLLRAHVLALPEPNPGPSNSKLER